MHAMDISTKAIKKAAAARPGSTANMRQTRKIEEILSVFTQYITDEDDAEMVTETEILFLMYAFPVMIGLVVDAAARWIQLDMMLK